MLPACIFCDAFHTACADFAADHSPWDNRSAFQDEKTLDVLDEPLPASLILLTSEHELQLARILDAKDGIMVMSGAPHTRSPDLLQDLAAFLLIRGPYSWLGWGWKGCSQEYYFPPEFNEDYGEPVDGALCKETAADSEIFTREFSKATVQLDCKQWKGTVTPN